tara:strand:+ start:429 stop:998 length:570 start_codon:yes stop_codon:yes gene_type:complete
MSILKTNQIQTVAGKPILHSTGGIIQVVSTYHGDRFTSSSTSWTDITNFNVSITPSSSSNKIYLMCCMGSAGVQQNNLDHGNGIRVMRSIGGGGYSDNNKLNGPSAGSRQRITYKGVGWSYNSDHMPGGLSFCGLDDPATTSAITYKVQVLCQSSSYAFSMNRCPNNADGGQIYQSANMSSLTVMEVTA